MSLTYYKATKTSKGSLLSINFSAKTDKVENGQLSKGDKSFYFNLVGQTAWNEDQRTGSFKDGKKIIVKLSPLEIGGIISSITKNTTLASVMGQEYVYHDGDKTSTTIYFGPHYKKVKQDDKWVDTTTQLGFGLRVVKTEKANKENKEQLAIGLNYAETELLVNYLRDALSHVFNAYYSEDVSRPKKENNNPKAKEEKHPENKEIPSSEDVDF